MTVGNPVKQGQLDPMALSPPNAAKVLSAAGGTRIEVEQIEADIEDGAPTNPDGTINLIHYAAWLVAQMGTGGAALGH